MIATTCPHTPTPCRVGAAASAWPLFDADSTRRLEAAALALNPDHALMARAGLSVARLAVALAPHAQRIVVLAGPGNNGGDGLIAAMHLANLGRQITVLHLADPLRLPPDAAHALQLARQAGVQIVNEPVAIGDCLALADLLIDALLGLGAAREPAGNIAAAIDAANGSGQPVLAIDLPSGLHADTGRRLGAAAIRARWTLSLLTLKPGLFTARGRDHAGEVWFDDLGQASTIPPTAWLGSAVRPPPAAFATRQHAQHKGSFGDVYVVGGAAGMPGAAWLAARAALTAGGGRVYLSPLSALPASETQPELMQSHAIWQADGDRLQRATVVCGCGGGADVAQTLPRLIDQAARLLLDADALNAVAADACLQAALSARAARGLATVLTPHPLEAARLAGCTVDRIQQDRLAAASQLALRFASVVLLKGSGTVVASPAAPPWINASGNACLATPGSGDVLAGWIGGMWSAVPATTEDGARAACAAAWLHGHAADRWVAAQDSRRSLPLRAHDLIDAMAAAIG